MYTKYLKTILRLNSDVCYLLNEPIHLLVLSVGGGLEGVGLLGTGQALGGIRESAERDVGGGWEGAGRAVGGL